MLDGGARKTAVLDVDFRHGNGTQDIFYRRGNVFFASIHGRPEDAFPHFLGFANETGEGEGEDANLNLPLPPGTGAPVWFSALDHALTRIEEFGAEALVVSLGVDAFRDDPISFFKLSSDDFTRCGARIAHAGLPTVFALEGGYAVEAIGVNVVNTLEGFLGR
jgi:acetoin utilization deacetylase AcuC-like enzyme